MKIEQLSPPVHTAKRRRSPWSAYRVALIVIAGLVASVGAHLKVTYDKAIRDAETLISALAIASEQHIGGSLAGIDALLDELAANVREGRHTDTHFSNDFAARLPSYPEVKYIGIVNADGVLQPDTWPPRPLPLSPEGVNVSANKYFTAQRDSKGPARMVFGDPVAGPAEDGRSLYLSRPIRDRSGRFVGVAVASVDPDAYATFLSSILYDENGACALIGQDGSILARAPNQVSEFGRNIGDSDLIRIWAPRSPVGVAHLVAKTDGNDKLLAYRVMPEFGLMVSAGVSRSRALADWHRMVLAELTLLTAFSGMLLYWTRRIKRHDEEQAQIEQELERAVETRTDELKAARMLAEQRAVQLGWINAELRRLAQVASHHLQEPLRAIVSCGQMVRRSLPQPIAGLDDAVEGMCYEGIALKTHLGDFEKHVSTISDAAVDDDPCAAGPPEERAPPSPSLGSHSFKARAVAATIILVVLAGHGLQLRADYRNAIVASERLTGAVVNTIEHHLRSSFRRVDNLLNDVTLAVEDDRHQSQAFHERMLARLTTVPEVRYVSVADAEGRVSPHTWPAHALSPQDRNVAGRDFFRGQRASAMHGNLVIGQPRLDPATGERELVFSQPVVGPTGRFAGIVFASVDPDLYARFLDTVLLDEDGGTAVIALDGHMVARAPKHEEKFALDISGSDLFTQYLPNGPSGTAHLVSKTDGNRKLLGYQVVDDFPLVVTSGYSIDKALGEWNLIAVSTTAMAVIASAILFAWAWRADRHARNQFHYRHDLAAQVALRTAGLAAAHQAAEARSNSLAEANARLEDLSRIITADMRAPLRALTDHIATVERLAGGRTEECDHWLAFISAGGIHLKALLRDYQRFVSALSGAPRLRDVDCDEIVRGAARLVESMWKDKVRFSVAPLPHVHGDRDMLLEVFLQLFSNAAIHSKDAQQVTVTVRADRQGDEWRISVADDGPGLPPVNPEHLFRAFETAHNRDPDSTGLGLPLCRIIIQCHDGRIWATSRRGKGTEFHFTLPAAPALATPREAA